MMNNEELLALLKAQRGNTLKADDKFEALNRALFESYNQDPYGNEEEGRSQVVASDHFDTVEADQPSLARVFLGSNKVLHFQPFGEDDKEEADQKTKYADYLIRQQPNSFKTIHDWLKEPGLSKISVLKYYPEEKTRVHYVSYKGVSLDELTVFMEDLKQEKDVSEVSIESKEELDEETYDVNVRVRRTTKKIAIVPVPWENFGITINASSKEDAELAFDECYKRKGELIAEGFDEDLVKSLLPANERDREMYRKRAESQGGYDIKSGYHWTNEEVLVTYYYSLADKDGDGIPERRMIVTSGETILDDVPYDHVPYAILSQILMPHTLIGKSRGEYASRIQKQKTAVERAMMDNIYSVGRPRTAIDDSSSGLDGGKVDIDDLMNRAIDGIIRVDGNPAEAIMPLVTPYIGDSSLQIIQYIEARRSNALGTIAGNQGLDADKFYKETATRFEGVQESSAAKIELVARVYAETGFRQLYEGVIWTAQHFQDTATEIMVLGEPLMVDPRQWRYEHYCQSDVGLGVGDSEDAINNLAAQLGTQMQLLAVQSPLVDWQKIYATLDDLSRAMGKPDTSRYYNDPEVPEQQLMFMVQKLMADNQALMQQASQNPLSEAEMIRAQAKLVEAESKQQVEAAKMAQDQQQFMEKMQQDQRQFMADLAKQLTELELKYQQDVPGSTV